MLIQVVSDAIRVEFYHFLAATSPLSRTHSMTLTGAFKHMIKYVFVQHWLAGMILQVN